MMDTSDNAAMDGVDILTPEQVRVSKNVESSDDSEYLFICKSCDMSFESNLDIINTEIDMHSISSWSEEVDTEEKMDEYVKSDASKKRKWDCDGEIEAESDGQMSSKRHKSVIETNPQFGAGRVEPEKEKNPQQ